MIMKSPNATAASVHHFLFSSVTSRALMRSSFELALARLATTNSGTALLTRSQPPAAYHRRVPVFICPNCRTRSVDVDGTEGFSREAPQCRSCGFGFLFQLLEDYYPAPSTGFVVCDRDARVLAVGRGVFELTGYREADLIGRDVASAFALSDTSPLELVREWGVRRLGEQLELRTRAGLTKPVVVDLFPAYDDDGGLLVALTSR
jgi:PAS domain S-box-containing protein